MTVYRQKKKCNKPVSTPRIIKLGGNSVDDEYLTLMSKIFTEAVLSKMKIDFPSDYNDMLSNFELSKRAVNRLKKIPVRIPYSLITTYENMTKNDITDAIHKSKYNGSIDLIGDKIRILPELYRQLYQRLCEEIIVEINKMLQDNIVTPISSFFLVGGLADSQIVQQFIKEAFPEKQILVSNESGEVVRKGALQFMLYPNHVISSRTVRQTFGIRVQPLFDASIHDPKKRFYLDGVFRCMDVFDVFIKSGENVTGKKFIREVKTIRKMQKYVEITIVCSTRQNPLYVDEPDCSILGKLTFFVGDVPVGHAMKVSIDLSGTEITVEVEDKKTDQRSKACFAVIS